MPKVSVIIPVYNVEKYLRECLDSVVNQTLKDIEIICVNDGSTDNSLKILEEYASQDSRIKIINQENQGAGAARNKGLEFAQGEYLSFLDSDDYFEPDMLKMMYDKSKLNDLDIVVVKSRQYDLLTNNFSNIETAFNVQFLPKKEIFNYSDATDYIFNIFNGWAWDKLFKKDFILLNKIKFQNLPKLNDMYFVYAALILAKKISIIDEVLITHRINISTQLSANYNEYPNCFLLVMEQLKKLLVQLCLYEKLQRSFINRVIDLNFLFLKKLPPKEANKLAKKLKKDIFPQLDIYSKPKDFFFNFKNIYEELKDFAPNSFLFKHWYERLFSIKNTYKHKIITFLGIKIRKRHNALISIIIPAYNTEKYLDKCLQSMLNQTFKNIEVICINDGSTDNSLQIMKKFAQKDKRFVVIDKPNTGQADCRNIGLELAKGSYIMFCDSDDTYQPNMCKKMLNTLIKQKVDLVNCNTNINVEAGHKRPKSNLDYKKLLFRGKHKMTLEMRKKINVILWNKIFKKSLINQYNIRFPKGYENDDDAFVFQYCTVAQSVYGLKDKLHNFLARDNSVMDKVFKNKNIGKKYDRLYSMIFYLEFLEKNNLLKENLDFYINRLLNETKSCFEYLNANETQKANDILESLILKLNNNIKSIILDNTSNTQRK